MPSRLDGFGYIAPQRTRRDVLGVQWCSSIFPDRAPPGMVLLRAMCGGWHRAEIVDWDDDRLLAAVRAELRQAMGIAAEPVFHHIVRWDRAIPQYHLGHLERVAWIEERAATPSGSVPGRQRLPRRGPERLHRTGRAAGGGRCAIICDLTSRCSAEQSMGTVSSI